MERLYFSEWLFNAGIVGFLGILLKGKTDIREGENIIDHGKKIFIGSNYIEFERNILEGFADAYFEYAYERYKRVDRFLEKLKKVLEKIEDDKEEWEKDYEEIVKRIDNFKALKDLLKKENIEIRNLKSKKDSKEIKNLLEKFIECIKEKETYLKENDVKIYLQKIYGQKSFLNNALTSNFKNKFRKEFEDKILKGENKIRKGVKCISCGERFAKKDTFFDSGLSPFLGINLDASNFFWDLKAELPLCEICELIYFCSFGGFTESVLENKYFFVNMDTSVVDLYKKNMLLKMKLEKDLNKRVFVEFLSELLLKEELEKSTYSLESIAFIEIDLNKKDVLPKVFSFNISRAKAEFLQKHAQKTFYSISELSYKIKDLQRNVLIEILEKLLNGDLNYNYLHFLSYLCIQNINSKLFNPEDLQKINILIGDYLFKFKKSGGVEMSTGMSEEKLWFMFKKGEELAKKLIEDESENKIPSIAYKLLSHLRIEDTNSFLNEIFRFYIGYKLEVPTLFVEAIKEKDLFLSYGYSFVNGILFQYTKRN